jgi:hypothetical protein
MVVWFGWWCDVEEKKRKRTGGKKRLYASAGRVSRQSRRGTCAGRHSVRTLSFRHHWSGEGKHVKLIQFFIWQSPSLRRKACDRVQCRC